MAQEESKPAFKRPIRSYVVRGGRLTPSQEKAMQSLWPVFGLELEDGMLDPKSVFGRQAELVFEIGFGMGHSLLEMAAARPDRDFIGVDVHPPGIGTLLRGIGERELKNIRIYQGDAKLVLANCIPDQVLERILVFFPDPWHKKRHHKRRLIEPEFVQVLGQKLTPGGVLHLATDWQNYAGQMLEVMSHTEGFINLAGPGQYSVNTDRPQTKFERRGLKLGHGVWDLEFARAC